METHSTLWRQFSPRIVTERLKQRSLERAFRIVEPEQPDRNVPDFCAAQNEGTFELEMLVPRINSRIKQPRERARSGRERANIRPFVAVAARTGQRQVREVGGAAVFAADDMIDFAACQQRGLRHETIFATTTRAGDHLPSKALAEALNHAAL